MPLTPRIECAFFSVLNLLQFNYVLKGSMIFPERNNISHCLIVFTQWRSNDIQHPSMDIFAMQCASCTHKDKHGIAKRLVHSIISTHRKLTVEFDFFFLSLCADWMWTLKWKWYASKCGIIMWNGTTPIVNVRQLNMIYTFEEKNGN